MDWLQALILGAVQGLTEYLPVSSSGHLTIGSYLFGINPDDNLTFTVAVHVATVLSTLVILWKEVAWIFKGLFKCQKNDETRYVLNIVVSMIPIGIVGVFFKDTVEEIFGSGLAIVGSMLLVTALLLTFSYFARPRTKESISVTLGQHHCDRPASWQQERTAGAVLVPYGYTAYSRRGTPRHHQGGVSWRRGCRRRHFDDRIGSGLPVGVRFRLSGLQMDDRHREKGQTDIFRNILCHRRCRHTRKLISIIDVG